MDTVLESVEVKRPRYRRHTIEFKREVVQKTLEPAASVARVAREHGVNANQVWSWRRMYAQGLLVAPSQEAAMLPVVLDEGQSLSSRPLATSETQAPPGGSIRLECGRVSVNIDGVPDPEVLRQVLDRVLR